MKRAIVTGASGFIGANLTRRLLQDGHDVHLLLREGYLRWRIEDIFKDVQIHIIDLNDKAGIENVIKSIHPELIFHIAAYGNYSWQNNLDQIIQTNFIGTINLLEACLKVGFEAFVNTGSSSEYGLKNYPPPEYDSLEPNSYYAVTKASAALFCRYSAQKYKAHITTLRLYSVYGPYEEPERLIPTLIINGLNGKLPPLVNPGIARDFVYIDDVIDAYLLSALKKEKEFGAIYNIGSGIQVTIRELVETAMRVLKINVSPQWGSMQNRDWDTSVWIANNNEAGRKLGWKTNNTIEQGLSKTVDWLCNNPQYLNLYIERINK